MADNKVNFLRGTSAEYEAKTKDNDTFYYTTDTKKLYLGETEVTGIGIDDTSTTATDKTWSAKKINDSIPTELPANGGNADTVNTIAGDIGTNTGNVYPVFVDSNNSTSTAETLKTSELLQFWGNKSSMSLLTIGKQKSSSGLLRLYDSTVDYFSALRAANNPSSDVNCYLPNESGTLALKEDIPAKLPANGGNADTIDGKHASDFMQNLGYLSTGSLLDYVLTLTSSGSFFISNSVTDTPVSGLFYGVDVIRYTGGDYVITATRFNGGGVWTNRYNAGMAKWYGWANVADNGNADTVDGLHANEIASNRNLLDNPDFRINQRGQTDYSASGSSYAFILDRWVISRAVVSVVDNGISAAWNGTDNTNGWIQQHIENAADFAGMTITVSALVDGEVLSGTTTVPTTVNGSNSIATSNPSIRFTVGHYSNDRLGVAIILSSATPCVIGWVKAEIGKNTTPFVPPNPAEELAKCQRHFNSLFVGGGIPVQFVGSGIAVSDNMATILINLPTVMRSSAPTVSLIGTLYLADGSHNAENSITVQGISGSYLNRNVLQLNLTSNTTLDRTAVYLLSRRDKDTTLTVSAEL